MNIELVVIVIKRISGITITITFYLSYIYLHATNKFYA